MLFRKDNPSHNLSKALDFVWPAYALSEDRMDSLNRRLEILASTPLIAIPAFVTASKATTDDKTLISFWFIAGVALLAIGAMIALWSRRHSQLKTMSLEQVRTVAHEHVHDFSDRVLATADRDIRHNAAINSYKGIAADRASAALIVGASLLIAWLAI